MKETRGKSISIIKIIGISLILILMFGINVMATEIDLKSIEITMANGYTMTVLTNRSTVAEVLADNNIIVEEDEKINLGLETTIENGDKILITNKSEQEIQIAKLSESGLETTLEDMMKSYSPIIEKIIVEQETIPYETITKDASQGATDTKNKIIQQGQEGLKEVIYKVKYQNDTEIEKIKLSETVIKEPVNKIVQVQRNVVTSRSDATRTNGTTKIFEITAYCACSKCCGKQTGITASGTVATQGRTVAASSLYAFGTKFIINGQEYIVEDRGGAITGNKIDIYMDSHQEALNWGRRFLPVEVVQ